jgi:hypothetical protein
MRAFGQESSQPFRRLRDRIGPRDTDDVEALRAGGGGQRGLERSRIG